MRASGAGIGRIYCSVASQQKNALNGDRAIGLRTFGPAFADKGLGADAPACRPGQRLRQALDGAAPSRPPVPAGGREAGTKRSAA